MTGNKNRLMVRLNGGGPWGFRLQGGAGTGLSLVVAKVRRKSKAHKNLYEGDLIVSVNGKSSEGLTYDQVMEIADKSGTCLNLEVVRQESNKENVAPLPKPVTTTTVDRTINSSQPEKTTLTKEVVSMTETQTKVTEESEGLRIKSVTVLPESATIISEPARNTSHYISSEKEQNTSSNTVGDSFPNFLDTPIVSKPQNNESKINFDASTKTSSQEIISDDKKFEKTLTETVHEKLGNTETTIVKKEYETVIKNQSATPFSLSEKLIIPDIPLNSVEKHGLLNGTTKELDICNDSFKSKVSEVFQTEKTETSTTLKNLSESFSSTKTSCATEDVRDSIFSSLNNSPNKSGPAKKIPPPIPPKPKIRPFSDSIFGKFIEQAEELLMGQTLNTTESGSMKLISADDLFSSSEDPFSSLMVAKKKKMFSSSSFYEEPHAIYPTVEEQVEMAKKIADSLADDTNKKSKGANMFFKRVKKSTKWVHEGPEPSDESAPGTPEIQSEPQTPDPSQIFWKTNKGLPKLKLVLDPCHTQDIISLRSTGNIINEHNVVSPDICHDLVRDLESPVGKGAALFAKRKKKSSEWIVDEEKVKTHMQSRSNQFLESLNSLKGLPQSQSAIETQRLKLLKTPWEAALESPIGCCDAAFMRVDPGHLAETVIKAADNKRRDSVLSYQESGQESCRSPPIPITPAGAYYDIYKAKAPKGWIGTTSPVNTAVFGVSPVPPYSGGIGYDVAPPLPESVPTSTLSRKISFQNFNTLPRKWKAPSCH